MKRPRKRTVLRVGALLVASAVLAFAALTASASSATTRTHVTSAGSPATAIAWNQIAVATVRAAGPPAKFQLEGLIYMSYVQASVYDAVTKIQGRYAPYHDFTSPVDPAGASPDAAVAAAAYTALFTYFPSAALTTTYTNYLAALPAAGKDAGVAIGIAAAQDIIDFRAGDGRDAVITTPYGQGPLTPGVWIFPPLPSLQSAQMPWAAFMTPFMLDSPSQVRPGPPLAIDSNKYATQLAELEAYGGAVGAASTVRTLDQTNIAWFWNGNAINQVNQTTRDLASTHGFDLVETTRALAMDNLVDSDAGIACWDAKYHYTFWRPVTAIQHADIDGNDRTTADPNWTSLLTTPNHPEYPAAHGCLTSADAEVDAKLLDTHRIEVDIPGATGGGSTLTTSRHYATVEELDREIVNARVWAGLHFRNSGEVGVKLGRDVAHWTLDRYFLPTS
jgi:hypothetical protein